jgi:hypothetical protein
LDDYYVGYCITIDLNGCTACEEKLKFEKIAENLLLSWKYVLNIDSRKMLADISSRE